MTAVPCSVCAVPIEVDTEAMSALGASYDVYHEACGGLSPAPPQRHFVVSVKVAEVVGGAVSPLPAVGVPPAPPISLPLSNGVEFDHEAKPVKYTEDLVALSAEADGTGFVAALPLLERRLGELWLKVKEHAPVVDSIP